MATAILTAQRLREVLHYDPTTGVFTRKVTTAANALQGNIAGTTNRDGRKYICVDKKRYAAHRLAWLYVTGEWPKHQIDHINGNHSDNRLENLRDVTCSINNENKRAARSDNLSTGILGVSWCDYHKKYKAHIRIDGKLRHLKYCKTAEEAREVYLEAKRKFHVGCTI